MDEYPKIKINTMQDMRVVLERIVELRDEDVSYFSNLNQFYVSGRLVQRVPTSSSNVLAGDNVGDISFTSTYLYVLQNVLGTPAWLRAALSTF